MPLGVRDLLRARAGGWEHLLMYQDDPEKRIAELKRRLAEARTPRGLAPPSDGRSALTTAVASRPNRSATWPFPSRPSESAVTTEGEVDAFLDRVEAALRDPARCALTVEQVRSVAFPGRPGKARLPRSRGRRVPPPRRAARRRVVVGGRGRSRAPHGGAGSRAPPW